MRPRRSRKGTSTSSVRSSRPLTSPLAPPEQHFASQSSPSTSTPTSRRTSSRATRSPSRTRRTPRATRCVRCPSWLLSPVGLRVELTLLLLQRPELVVQDQLSGMVILSTANIASVEAPRKEGDVKRQVQQMIKKCVRSRCGEGCLSPSFHRLTLALAASSRVRRCSTSCPAAGSSTSASSTPRRRPSRTSRPTSGPFPPSLILEQSILLRLVSLQTRTCRRTRLHPRHAVCRRPARLRHARQRLDRLSRVRPSMLDF